MKIRPEIQGLRALSVLLVVFNHAFPEFLPGGYFGVDIFFVISGFLITTILLTDSEKSLGKFLLDFYARRIRRVLPSALLVIVISACAARYFLGPIIGNDTARDGIFAALFTSNWHFNALAVNYFSSDLPAPILQHYWSLSIEEQFYIFWPLILFIALRLKQRPLLFITAISGASFLYALAESGERTAYFATGTRIWELGVGAALATVRWRFKSKILARTSIVTLIALAFVFNRELNFIGFPALLVVLLSAVALVTVTDRGLLTTPLLVRIGDMSYVIYLWHWSVLQIARLYYGKEPGPIAMVVLLVLIALLSIVTHFFFENPIRYSKRLISAPSLTVTYGLTLLIGAIVLLKVVHV